MTITELLPILHRLSRADKLCVMQFLIEELVREEDALQSNKTCPVWDNAEPQDTDLPTQIGEVTELRTPQESLKAARSLLKDLKEKALRQDENGHENPT